MFFNIGYSIAKGCVSSKTPVNPIAGDCRQSIVIICSVEYWALRSKPPIIKVKTNTTNLAEKLPRYITINVTIAAKRRYIPAASGNCQTE